MRGVGLCVHHHTPISTKPRIKGRLEVCKFVKKQKQKQKHLGYTIEKHSSNAIMSVNMFCVYQKITH